MHIWSYWRKVFGIYGDSEANPDKIHDIINMKSPTAPYGIQKLNGRLVAPSCFLTKGVEKSL